MLGALLNPSPSPSPNFFPPLSEHRIMLHPRARGTVKWIAPAGEYTIVDPVLKTEFNGKETEHTMLQVRCGQCDALPYREPFLPTRSGLCASCAPPPRSWRPTTRC